MNVEALRAKAIKEIDVPGFNPGETEKFKVKNVSMMKLMSQGKIPNHLMGSVVEMLEGKTKKKKDETELTEQEKVEMFKEYGQVMELYCVACMVEPTYEDIADIITDAQMMAIFSFGIKEVEQLNSFRNNGEDGTNNPNGERVQEKA